LLLFCELVVRLMGLHRCAGLGGFFPICCVQKQSCVCVCDEGRAREMG